MKNFKPTEIRLEISTICNAKCVFCPHPTDEFTRKKLIMSLEDFKFYLDKTLKESSTISDIGLSGFGEIFSDKHVLSKLQYANTKGLPIHLLTNASLLNEEMLEELFKLENLQDIRISIHTNNENKYNQVMAFKNSRIDFYKKVRSNINYIVNNKPSTLDLILTAVIDPLLKDEVEDLIKEYKDKCYLEIWKPHNWVYGKNYRQGDALKNSCGRPNSGPIEVLVNGDVNMCCFDFNNRMKLGNLKEQSLEEIYDSYLFNKIKTHHNMGTCKGSGLICDGCDQLYVEEDTVVFNKRVEEASLRINQTSTNLNVLRK